MAKIRQRSDRTFQIIIYVGRDRDTGTERRVYRTFHGSKREATRFAAKLETELGNGTESADTTHTVTDLFDAWLDTLDGRLSPRTIGSYDWLWRHYLEPRIGRRHLHRLKTVEIDRLYIELERTGSKTGGPLSASTVRHVHATLHRALDTAIRWEWLATNPADRAALPPKPPAEQGAAPDPAIVIDLVGHATDDDPEWGLMLRTLITTGIRRGELCALRWSSIDFEACRLAVSANVVIDPRSGELVDKSPKGRKTRRISLDPDTLGLFREQRRRCAERALACGVGLDDDAYVFATEPDGSVPFRPDSVTKRFARLRDRHGIEGVRLHDLRHFNATRLLAAGEEVGTVADRLGHADTKLTLTTYRHWIEEADRQAAATIANIIDAHG